MCSLFVEKTEAQLPAPPTTKPHSHTVRRLQVPQAFGSMWLSRSAHEEHSAFITPVIRDFPFHIRASVHPPHVSHLFKNASRSRHPSSLIDIHQVTAFLRIRSGQRIGSTHAEVSCQRPGEEGVRTVRAPPTNPPPKPPNTHTQPPCPAHARPCNSPLLSGGCLDAVKSCF